MIKKLILLFIVATLLIGCGPVTPVVPEPTPEPIIKFQTANFLCPPQEKKDVNLSVGIYALDDKTIFLIGSMGSTNGCQQSTLLRSSDGGKHWIEAIGPVRGSQVDDFQMFGTGEGWALILWVVEDPGDVLLFHTIDFGQSWKLVSKVEKPDSFSVPANMAFFDSKNGQMIMSVVEGLHNRLAFMTTTDGGLTWKETDSYSPPFDPGINISAIDSLLYSSRKNFKQSTSLNYDSQWRVETIDDSIIIYRQLHENYSWSNWEIANTLPKQFDYKDGQIIIP